VLKLNVLAKIILYILAENTRAPGDFLTKKLAGWDRDGGLSGKGLFPISFLLRFSGF
jgi:dihydroorotate dehydrogenase